MPSIDVVASLRTWLLADPALTGLVADRIYHRLPSDVTWPAIRLTRVGGTRTASGTRDRPLVMVDVFDADPVAATATAEAVRDRLNAIEFGAATGQATALGICGATEQGGPRQTWDTTRDPAISHQSMTWQFCTRTTTS